MPRTLPDPSPAQADALNAIARAADERAKWDRIYLESIHEAGDLGCTAVQISRFTGTTYQAVQKILARRPRD
ncbi:hypothetical protein [Williamsia deligens]|uniref:Helix-turn-helix DNA binding domain protein n=1 Tax=Williamsia deligens TaxID=321325 RepID=A0ABW3G8Y2_9NOCA|nr:hypothetical protein [Williamsia deligens]MCP2192312.1 hypothetical protein [Williamsia deligens]